MIFTDNPLRSSESSNLDICCGSKSIECITLKCSNIDLTAGFIWNTKVDLKINPLYHDIITQK